MTRARVCISSLGIERWGGCGRHNLAARFSRPFFGGWGGVVGVCFGIVHMNLVIPRNAQLILLLHGVLAVGMGCVTLNPIL